MKADTRILARMVIGLALVALFVALASVAYAQGPPEGQVCPNDGKIDADFDGQLDDLVLEEGTTVCIKGGKTLVTVVADGSSTLAELLGTGQNVSHYTIISLPPTTTTTTSIPETTSTTVNPSSTTTMPETTTTQPKETTTSEPEDTTTSQPSTPTSTEGQPAETPSESRETLPETGLDNPLALIGAALALLTSGGLLLRKGTA